ncbi:DUF459 domain-containing protein [Microcoleus sp. FACHB-68]|uniref:SGNH/GDSL hydrolase family protein n=1 Tax=Microcoleus sp. FACHB-68 TaxID=2692826 RepID=UPI0016831F10|nr:DUF459 domain-containing protein [Microcoleus sp. FACHB-68]MBD1937122.1 DUF459 domain-containing protein [Microcoleus sp. FACHB-68]
MKDRDFLLIVISVTLILIFSNFTLFIKSLASSKFANPQLKQAAEHLKIESYRKNEQAFWSKIKEVNIDEINITSENVAVEKPLEDKPKQVPDNKPKQEIKKPNKQPTTSKSKAEKPYSRFLVVGDSIVLDIGVQLQSTLQKSYKITQIKIDYKISTGLNRIDYYDWYARTTQLIKAYKPDVLVVMFGGNDDQDITDFQGKYRRILTTEWKQAYRERVEKYAKLVSSPPVRKVYWIGQPISSKPRYSKFFLIFNEIYRDVSKNYPKIEYISSWEKFSVGGKFAPILADKAGKRGYVKANDGVHLTPHGAKILSNLVIEKMLQDKILKKLESKPALPKVKPTTEKVK